MQKHVEYQRIVENSKVCVLFCHGILGSPCHFENLIEIIPNDMSVCNLLLKGHGASVIDFGKSNMKQWQTDVEEAIEKLSAKHESIIYVCHSMGSLFGIENAIKCEKIKSLFVLASPLYPKASFKSVIISLKIIFGNPKKLGKMADAKNQVCSVELTKKLWQYIAWVPRFCELLKKSKQTRKIIGQVNCSGIFIQSAHDEVVKSKSSKLISKNKNFKLITLKNSSHYLYDEDDEKLYIKEFENLIKINSNNKNL